MARTGQKRGGSRRARRGFTLMELLLVVMISAILAAVSVPYMVGSIRGNRLRSASRSTVQTIRYARSMAVLSQAPFEVLIEWSPAAITAQPLAVAAAPAEPEDAGAPGPLPDTGAGGGVELDADGERVLVVSAPRSVRHVLEGIRVTDVQIVGESTAPGGVSRIPFRRNGRCPPHEIRFEDENGGTATIRVDTLGSARSELRTGTR